VIVFLFGKAGCGKTHIGELASQRYGFHFYDADADLTERFREAIKHRRKVTDEIRDEYIERIIATIKRLRLTYRDICVSQALVRDKYRHRILDAIPNTQFVWVDAPDDIIAARLRARTGHPAPLAYAEMVNSAFETPSVEHVTLVNGTDQAVPAAQLDTIFART
jgi:gluconokinase